MQILQSRDNTAQSLGLAPAFTQHAVPSKTSFARNRK